ncbi:MAG: phosphatase PAP2 family protein [Rikenella sp.]|nr:phosphatase PAP2 family protein [Rikenella sp.]
MTTTITPFLFDQNLLLALNFDGGTVMDWIMYAISGRFIWIPFYICILWIVYARLGLRMLILFVLFVPLLITCADQTATLAKTYLPKERPTHFEPIMAQVHTVNGYVGGAYGTVSSHAANCFGLALFSSLLIRRRWFAWMMFVWAAVVSYSRIYLGVHYPMDILFGTVEGLFWAWVWYRALRWTDTRIGRAAS